MAPGITVPNAVVTQDSTSATPTVSNRSYFENRTNNASTVSANQALSTSKSDSKSISNSYTNGTSVSLSLPPYTSVVMQEEVGRSSATIAYDCPVVLRYKVAVFSMSGFRYKK